MDGVTLLGLAAGALTTSAFLPQVVKAWRTRSTQDLSFGTFILFNVGILMWLLYGIVIRDLPIIVTNLVTFVLAFTVLVLMLRNRKVRQDEPD